VTIVSPRPAPAEQGRLRALAHELGVELDLRVGISDGELASLYRAAHVTLYLARREPLGLASLEAQACGCPVIVADEGGLPETIVDGVTGYRTPLDPASAASFVDQLADARVHERISAAAVEHARQCSWQASATQIQKLLDALANGHVEPAFGQHV
jgi:D-inositol-3-phosphate glycosyltransferase